MNKKNIIWIVVLLFLLVIIFYFFYRNKINDDKRLNNETQVKINQQKEKGKTLEEEIAELEKKIKNAGNVKEKASHKRRLAYKKLETRDIDNMKSAVNDLKWIMENVESNEVKSETLNSLGNMYFRTGGNIEIFDSVFSDNFKKYKGNANGKVIDVIINLYTDAYDINPNKRSAIELVYWYADKGDFKNAEKWLKISDTFNGVFKRSILVREFEAIGKMLVLKPNNSEYLKGFNEIYFYLNRAYNLKDVKTNSDYRMSANQEIPFFNLFYASTMYKVAKDVYKKEIESALKNIVSFVKNDPELKYNEFQYFLDIQKEKEGKDVMGKNLVELAEASNDFKEFLKEKEIIK